jgi:hypothetical protein
MKARKTKKTLKQAAAEYATFKQIGLEYANAVAYREVNRPYHYQTKVKIDGKDAMSMINTGELYAHVQTASRLGCDTLLEAFGDKLQVVFVKKLPIRPSEFYSD